VRNVSANPHIIVLVGGRMINENPGIVHEVGADGTGADALAALDLANSLVKATAARDHNFG
jgi:methanogenic corrinoid protein MtbC1